jgi:hypothetical protein
LPPLQQDVPISTVGSTDDIPFWLLFLIPDDILIQPFQTNVGWEPGCRDSASAVFHLQVSASVCCSGATPVLKTVP